MIKGKYLLIGASAIGFVLGGTYLYNLSRLSSELEIVTKAEIYKVSFTGIVLRVDVTLKNPTGGAITVKFPFVKMQYNASTFASSEVKDIDFAIPKFGEKQLDPIYISLSFTSLASNVPGLLKAYRTTGQAVIDVITTTTINGKIKYAKADKINIGKAANNSS